ncbi:MAG: hypothetical protein PUD15_08820 [Prevotella sp.]|nr:hypothetical protein [Prevotella sp.]
MGTFGIFAIIVTFILLVYYTVTIAKDLTKLNKKETETADVIPAADLPESENPVSVIEHEDGQFGIKVQGQTEEIMDPGESVSPEQRKKAEEKFKEAQDKCDPLQLRFEHSMSQEEFEAKLDEIAATFDEPLSYK